MFFVEKLPFLPFLTMKSYSVFNMKIWMLESTKISKLHALPVAFVASIYFYPCCGPV